jgi:hypothetical protein
MYRSHAPRGNAVRTLCVPYSTESDGWGQEKDGTRERPWLHSHAGAWEREENAYFHS